MRSSTRRRYDVRFVHRACVHLHWAHEALLDLPQAREILPLFEPIACDLEECFLGLYGEPIEYREHPDDREYHPVVALRHATDHVDIAAVSLAGVSARRRAVLPTEPLRKLLWQLRDQLAAHVMPERMPA